MDTETIRILLIEDEPVSAGITRRMLREAGLDGEVTVKGTLRAGLEHLNTAAAEIVLLDMGLPDSSGPGTVKEFCGRFPALPVIVMTGMNDEETGMAALKDGAQDYLVKGQFGHRELKRAISYAAERKELLNQKEELVRQLGEALERVKSLTGLLPICADCKKIRTPSGDWVQMETYISSHSEAMFTHGFCDNCTKKRLQAIK
jgi:DNA-binding response OmpR family regulator